MKISWKILLVTFLVVFLHGCVTTTEKEQAQTPPPAPPAVEEETADPGSIAEEPENDMQAAETEEPSVVRMYMHTVKYSGESISIISKWYTGDLMKYKSILEVNPSLDPKKIKLGDVIRIPMDMIVQTDPMPKSFVDSFYGSKEESDETPSGTETEATEEETEIFGPVE